MIGKNTIKLIKSLALKKYRQKQGLFLVEGDKMVLEAMHSKLQIKELIATSNFNLPSCKSPNIEHVRVVTHSELKQASLLKNPQNSIAICHIPAHKSAPLRLSNNLSIFLDGIQDPGNLGTILRISDWFGVEDIYASKDTVDFYNPKVIQASMGSFNRVNFIECDFKTIQDIAKSSDAPIYGTFTDGENIYTEKLPQKALVVMGNEGNGVSSKIEEQIEKRISIPNLSKNTNKAESLNVSIATAIICSEFKRMV